MKFKKIPSILRNKIDSSITIKYGQPKCTLIWLHGLGDSSQGFFSYFTHTLSPVYEGIIVKILQSPPKNITINNQELCNSWYDILSYDRFMEDEKKAINFDDVKQSQGIIDQHVKIQAKLWREKQPQSLINPFHRVFVGGFSQGGVMSLKYSLESTIPPAGAICFSGYMLKTAQYTNFKKVPMLLMHGTHDPLIREIMARKSYEKLMSDTHLVQYQVIDGLQHTVNLDQLNVLTKWINETFHVIQHIYGKQQDGKVVKQ